MEYLPIIVFIVYGIIRAVSGANEKEQQRKSHQPNVPKSTASPSEGMNNPKRTIYKAEAPKDVRAGNASQHTPRQTVYSSTPTVVSVEEQQKQQIERLKEKLNTDANDSFESLSEQDLSIGPAIQDAIKHHSLQNQNAMKERFKKDVKSNLNYKGLVNGIIMSEVLGAPRARKPYRNITAERRRNIQYK